MSHVGEVEESEAYSTPTHGLFREFVPRAIHRYWPGGVLHVVHTYLSTCVQNYLLERSFGTFPGYYPVTKRSQKVRLAHKVLGTKSTVYKR